MGIISVKLPSGELTKMKFPDDWSKEKVTEEIHKAFPEEQKPKEEFKSDFLSKANQNPLLASMASSIASKPETAQLIQQAAENPITEFGISAGNSLINALKNIGNLSPFKIKNNEPNETGFPSVEARNLSSEPINEPQERPFGRPKNLGGDIGSLLGNIAGSTTAFLASPGSTSIGGGLAAGFSQGEGGYMNRLKDALIGLAIPGLMHGKEVTKNILKSKNIKNKINELGIEKTKAERDVFSSKEKLAEQVNKKLESVESGKQGLEHALNTAVGQSESVSKAKIANEFKKAEKTITKKYNNLYEGFNKSQAGQALIKEPINIESLEKEFNLKPDDFSSDTKKLVSKLVGEHKEVPSSSIISSKTGKPVTEASIKLEQAAPAKVEDYINLWKQTRSEVADLRHSQRLASTPEAKREFRDKANKLEKFSENINQKTQKSLSDSDLIKYKNIQKGYLAEKVPFMEKPLLKNATEKHPEIPDNFFKKLNSLGVNELIDSIKSSHPKLADAIVHHDLREMTKLSSEELSTLLKGDFGKLINKDVGDSITGLISKKNAEDTLKKALSKVQTSEMGRKVYSNKINKVIEQHPELAEPFKSVADSQEKFRKLKEALQDEGIKHAEIVEALKKYKSAFSIGKTVAGPTASYLGIKRSTKKNDSNEY